MYFNDRLAAEKERCPNWAELPDRVIPEWQFKLLRWVILLVMMASANHPYHNLEHVLRVEARFLKWTAGSTLSKATIQAMHLAILLHDCLHCGSRYRQVANVYFHKDWSNEELAAYLADWLLRFFLSIGQRVLVEEIILATSFEQDKPDLIPRPDIYRNYGPSKPEHYLAILADVGDCTEGWGAWFPTSLRVMRESDLNRLPTSFEDWRTSQAKFLDYVDSLLANAVPLLTKERIDEIREGLSNCRMMIDWLKEQKDNERIAIAREVMEVGEERRLELQEAA